MSQGPATWLGATALSLLAHAGFGAGLLWILTPDDIPRQPTPETQMQLAAFQVPRSQAEETAPDADSLRPGDAEGTNVGQGAIPTSRAQPSELSSNRAAPLDASGGTVAASQAEAIAAPTTRPVADPVTAEATVGDAIQSLNASAETLENAALSADPATATDLQSTSVASQSVASARVANLTAPSDSVEQVSAPTLAALSAPVVGEVLQDAPTPSAALSAATPSMTPARVSTVVPTTTVTVSLPTTSISAGVSPSQNLQPQAPITASFTPTRPQQTQTASLSLPSQALDTSANNTLADLSVRSEVQTPVALEQAPVAPDVPNAVVAALPVAPATQPSVQTDTSPALAPPSEKGTAQLAFPGTGDGPVDPVSLAAFQSFMSPDDIGGAAAQVRDSISATLSAIPCSRLLARFDPDANTLIMTGHVPEDGLRETVLAAMQEKMGADIPVREDLLVLPSPQCGALTGISQVGLPQSTDQITNPLLVGEDTHAREFRYVDGQALVLDLQGADYDAYVYVDFFDAAGNVIHLTPNEFAPLERTQAEADLQIGSARPLSPGEPGLYIKIGPPYGQEIAVAFAASDALYDGTRPLVEPAEPYLAWLRERVREARTANPNFKGEWVYFFISTAAQ